MTSKAITITEASRSLRHYVHRVESRGELFLLCRRGKPVAELRPVPRRLRLGDLPAVLRMLPHMNATEADDFAADIEAARKVSNGDLSRS